jgi:hypothetical protein|tara:strand:- start:32362 stop:32547 length:186 start_codon:yes stop_codon:yes gene_type:complete
LIFPKARNRLIARSSHRRRARDRASVVGDATRVEKNFCRHVGGSRDRARVAVVGDASTTDE